MTKFRDILYCLILLVVVGAATMTILHFTDRSLQEREVSETPQQTKSATPLEVALGYTDLDPIIMEAVHRLGSRNSVLLYKLYECEPGEAAGPRQDTENKPIYLVEHPN